MKMSEAMRLGSVLHPQAFHALFIEQWRAPLGELAVIASCALGAACEAIGIESPDEAPAEWLELLGAMAECPSHECRYWPCATVQAIIIHLNDHHGYSRESIADWLQTVEGASEPNLKAEVVGVPV